MQLESALPIVRALADGVNPMTGDIFADDSPYAEPRTLRALFAAVEIMEKEVERSRRRERLPANFGKPWSEGENKTLVGEFDQGISLSEIASRHQRTHQASGCGWRNSSESRQQPRHS